MNRIKVEEIWAPTDEELEKKLNDIEGRIISVRPRHDGWYEVIYETS